MQNSIMELMWSTGHLSGGNADYVEELYENFLDDAESVPQEWRDFFKSLPAVNGGNKADVSHGQIVRQFEKIGKISRFSQVLTNDDIVNSEHEQKQVQVLLLISSYRVRGHQKASLDPLGIMHRERVPDLELEFHDLSPIDYNTVFQTGSLFISKEKATLREIVDTLERIYCNSVGYEFMHIVNLEEKQWIQQRIESNDGYPEFPNEVKRHLLERLTAAEGLEKHLDSKYPGTKRFGLEGGESLIPALDELIQRSGKYGAKEIVLGMAHRGRLKIGRAHV